MKKKYIAIFLPILLLCSFFLILCYADNKSQEFTRYNLHYKRPGSNIILITIETLRADHLGCYGYKRDTTPNIDSLAKEGIIFESVMSQAPWTVPSVISLLFSQNMLHDNVCDKGAGTEDYLSLPDVLRENNFLTGAIIAHDGFSFMERQFDWFDYIKIDKWSVVAEELTEKAIEWIESNKERKHFLWLHYWAPHSNYVPPRPFDEMYCTNYKGILKDKRCDIGEVRALMDKLSDDDVDYLISQYDGEINYTDKALKEFFKKLKELGMFDNTLIVICSDHGEEFGERNWFGHALTLYDELIHTPLIIINPVSDLKNVKIGNQARNLDIAPTILDVVCIQKPQTFEGVSLYKIMAEGLNPAAFSRTYPPFERKRLFCIQAHGYKLIYYKGPEYSKIMLPFLDKGDYKLIIRAWPFISNEEHILSVYLNHHLLGRIDMPNEWKEYQFKVDRGAIKDDRNILMFKSNCGIPILLSDSPDKRLLGTAFDYITFIHRETGKETKIDIGSKSARSMLLRGWHGDERCPTCTFAWSYQDPKELVELYDMHRDPQEKVNIAKKYPKIANKLIKELMSIIENKQTEAPVQMDKDTIKRFKALGYIN